MTVTIDGSTGVSLVQDGVIQQADLSVGVAGNGPCFSAYCTTAPALNNANYTKIPCNFKEFDTTNAFDNTTNFRFQPNVAGYYQITGEVVVNGTSIARLISTIWKNGAVAKQGADTVAGVQRNSISALIYLNGSSDYLEYFVYSSGTSLSLIDIGPADNYFQGYLARSA